MTVFWDDHRPDDGDYNHSALPPLRIQGLIADKGMIGPSLEYCFQTARPISFWRGNTVSSNGFLGLNECMSAEN
jgi:hypothetical protein